MNNGELRKILDMKNESAKIDILRKITYENPDDYKVFYALAKCLYKRNLTENNKELFFLLNEIIHCSDSKKLVHKAKIRKARVLESIFEYQYAEHILSNLLSEDENDYKAMLEMGRLKCLTLETNQARKYLKQALNSNDKKLKTQAYGSLISLYIEENDFENALLYLNKMIEDDHTKIYMNYVNYTFAKIYRKMNDYEKASHYIEKVDSLRDGFGELNAEKLYIYHGLGDEEKFSDTLENMGRYQDTQNRIIIEEALMNISLKDNDHFGAKVHKDKMLYLVKGYKYIHNYQLDMKNY